MGQPFFMTCPLSLAASRASCGPRERAADPVALAPARVAVSTSSPMLPGASLQASSRAVPSTALRSNTPSSTARRKAWAAVPFKRWTRPVSRNWACASPSHFLWLSIIPHVLSSQVTHGLRAESRRALPSVVLEDSRFVRPRNPPVPRKWSRAGIDRQACGEGVATATCQCVVPTLHDSKPQSALSLRTSVGWRYRGQSWPHVTGRSAGQSSSRRVGRRVPRPLLRCFGGPALHAGRARRWYRHDGRRMIVKMACLDNS